jgi:hypothetical protein
VCTPYNILYLPYTENENDKKMGCSKKEEKKQRRKTRRKGIVHTKKHFPAQVKKIQNISPTAPLL